MTEYTEMMGRARETATRRMITQATEMGADAIINIRYMTTSVVASAAELFAYGTALLSSANSVPFGVTLNVQEPFQGMEDLDKHPS